MIYKKFMSVLFPGNNEVKVYPVLTTLIKKVREGDLIAKQALADYALFSYPSHHQSNALACLATEVKLGEINFLPYFDFYLNQLSPSFYQCFLDFSQMAKKVDDPQTIVYADERLIHMHSMVSSSIEGKLNILGRDAYGHLVEIAKASFIPSYIREKAIKMLAVHSNQTFDKNLSSHSIDKALEKISTWAREGYPTGSGHSVPEQDPALKAPVTPLEILCAKLQAKLLSFDSPCDAANPSNLLVVPNKEKLSAINQKWKLPTVYAEFLQRFSPLECNLSHEFDEENEDSVQFPYDINILGVENLISENVCYASRSSLSSNFVLIAEEAHYLFFMDLSKSDGIEAPIYFMDDEMDTFEQIAPTFIDFLKKIVL